MTTDADITFTVTLAPPEALALAQFLKRVGWTELRGNAIDDDEAYRMRGAFERVQKALAEVGFAPR